MTHFDRRRVMLGLAGTAGLTAFAPGFGTGSSAFAQSSIYQWGSSSLGSTGYQIITVLAAAASRFTDGRHASLSTAGGAENMALIGEGLLDFGQSTTTDWHPAINGLGRYEGKPVDAVQVLSYMVWQCTPMVLADSGINTIDDLKGKRIMPAAAGGATNGLFQTFFEAAGLQEEVEWTYGSWSETYDALAAGAVDCIPSLLTSGDPSGILQRLEANRQVKVLPISEELIEKAQVLNPGVMASTVEPSSWATLSEPTLMLSFGGVLATRPDLPGELIYEITKAIYENADFVKDKGGARLKHIDLEFATRFLIPAYPVHAGAAQYFKEQGVWRDDLKEQA